jgi:hypothetical protein
MVVQVRVILKDVRSPIKARANAIRLCASNCCKPAFKGAMATSKHFSENVSHGLSLNPLKFLVSGRVG